MVPHIFFEVVRVVHSGVLVRPNFLNFGLAESLSAEFGYPFVPEGVALLLCDVSCKNYFDNKF